MILEFHELEFFEKIAFKFVRNFLMELKFMEKLSSLNSSTQKVIDSYIFPK